MCDLLYHFLLCTYFDEALKHFLCRLMPQKRQDALFNIYEYIFLNGLSVICE